MRRILLVIDDYREMMILQTLLKKLGFDAVAVQNDHQATEQMLVLRPEVVVADFVGSRIHALDLAKRMRRINNLPRFAVILPENIDLPDEQMQGAIIDAVVKRPFTEEIVLRMLAYLGELDVGQLLAKYHRLTDVRLAPEGNSVEPRTGSMFSSMSSAERAERYKIFLRNLPPPESQSIPHARVHTETLSLREMEQSEDLSDLEVERKNFVRYLFKRQP